MGYKLALLHGHLTNIYNHCSEPINLEVFVLHKRSGCQVKPHAK